MATTCYFEREIMDQGGEGSIEVEFGRSSFYSESKLDNGTIGKDSIYLNVNGDFVVMDLKTAKEFVDAAISVGRYHRLID